MPRLHIAPDLEAASAAVAERIGALAQAAVRDHAAFFWVLTGGDTPRRLYEMLAQPPYREAIPWRQVHVYFSDERCVPPDDAQSNYRLAAQTLLTRVPIPETQIHRMRAELPDPHAAAALYAQVLARLPRGAQGMPRLDTVLLGVGADGHIASLFPGTPALEEREAVVVAVYVEKLGAWRLSLTLPAIASGRRILALAAGAAKARAVRQALERAPGIPAAQLPAHTEWYLDQAAAELLREAGR